MGDAGYGEDHEYEGDKGDHNPYPDDSDDQDGAQGSTDMHDADGIPLHDKMHEAKMEHEELLTQKQDLLEELKRVESALKDKKAAIDGIAEQMAGTKTVDIEEASKEAATADEGKIHQDL